MTLIFPLAQVLLSLGAMIVYMWHGCWLPGLYWLFAAGITSVVTAMATKGVR